MPYPALPPELPPIVAVSPADLSHCASLPAPSESGASNPSPSSTTSPLPQGSSTASTSSAAQPERFPPETADLASDRPSAKKKLTFPLPPLPTPATLPTDNSTGNSTDNSADSDPLGRAATPDRPTAPSPRQPTAKPPVSPVVKAATPLPRSPQTKPQTRPQTKPLAKPPAKSQTKPPAKSPTKPAANAVLPPTGTPPVNPDAVDISLLPTTSLSPKTCAVLLGNATATGYLPTASLAIAPAPASTSQIKPVVASKELARRSLSPSPQGSPAPTTLQTKSDPIATNPIATSQPATTQAPATPPTKTAPERDHSPGYGLSGVSGQLATMPEKELITHMNQAVVFDGLVDSYSAFASLTEADLKRLATDKRATNRSTLAQSEPNPAGTISTPSDTLFPSDRFPVAPAPQPTPTPPPVPGVPPNDGTATPPTTPPVVSPDNVMEVTADRQDYNENSQIFTAEGNVTIRFRNGLLEADRVQVNLPNRFTVAEGNVSLTRGTQVLRGQRFEYNFVQGVGTVQKARGDIFLPTVGSDSAFGSTTLPNTPPTTPPISDRITSQVPQTGVFSPGGVNFSFGAGRDVGRVPGALPRGGELRRLRFEADLVDFTPEGWVAKTIDITNDPFSPPELVLRADQAVLTRISPLVDELVTTRPRIVFDQKVSVPFLRRRFILSREEPEPSYFRFAYDDLDRGGVYLEGILNVINTGRVRFSIYPQVFLQRMALGENSEGPGDLDNYGIRTALDVTISDRTRLRARVALTSLDFDEFENKLRASIRLQHFVLPTPYGFHRAAFEYSYRDRLFNGSLGFQTVQTSLGAVFESPNILLGNSGVFLNYQTGFQLVNADTDRLDLLEPIRTDNRVSLGRYQATASVGRTFPLWVGKPLPATRDEGLNYTPNAIVPQVSFFTSLRGVFSYYTSGDTQQDLIGTVGLSGQFGHFSRRFFDYTSFGVFYSQVVGSGESPFLFDRTVDNRIVSLSFFQQLYGPLRGGVQTSINVDTRTEISTDVFLEYSRRTHGIILRYNPVLELGSISFRISDFNWSGTAEPFAGSGVVPVDSGVERRD